MWKMGEIFAAFLEYVNFKSLRMSTQSAGQGLGNSFKCAINARSGPPQCGPHHQFVTAAASLFYFTNTALPVLPLVADLSHTHHLQQ